MRHLEAKDLEVGMTYFECQSGYNAEYVVVTPVTSEVVNIFDKDRTQWSWSARNPHTGDIQDFLITEGLEHYGPRLYAEPQYVYIRKGGGEPYFKIMGKDDA